MPDILRILNFLCVSPVSYTHLDVYKRQGFMQKLTREIPYTKSRIVCLPFINSSPVHPNTIYSAINYSLNLAKKLRLNKCFITFDQPLLQKASEIVETCGDSEIKSKVIIRLGGFHLLMSYIGYIGYTLSLIHI